MIQQGFLICVSLVPRPELDMVHTCEPSSLLTGDLTGDLAEGHTGGLTGDLAEGLTGGLAEGLRPRNGIQA